MQEALKKQVEKTRGALEVVDHLFYVADKYEIDVEELPDFLEQIQDNLQELIDEERKLQGNE